MVSRPVRSRPMRNLCIDRILGLAVVAFALSCAAPHAASAQAPPAGSAAAPAQPYWAAVNANNVFIRSSPSVNSSYPFGRLATGDVVQVMEESFGWARVRCTGPAFTEIHGFVPADRRVELSSDGTTLKVTARTEIKAPNINSKESPDASWKPIAKLAPGDSLKVLGTLEGDREKVYRVALNEAAEGFINLNYLRRASAAEADAYRSSGARRAVAGTPTTPANPTNPTPPEGNRGAGADAASANAGSGESGVVPAGASGNSTPSLADEARIRARPRGAAGSEEITETAAEIERVEITLPDGASETIERDTVVTRTGQQIPESARSPRDLEADANRREYEDLESIWDAVKTQAIENAEISVLRARYTELVTRANVPAELRLMAKARTEQLGLKLEVQERMYELERLRAQRGQDLDRMRAISLAMEARSDYDAIGVLNASTVFDGNRLPALYRLQDPAVGQTVAYVVPRADFELATMLGVLVGIRGEKRYDPALRVSVIEPRAVDILTQRRDSQRGGTAGGTAVSDGQGAAAGSESQPAPASSGEPVYYAPVPPDAR